MSEVLAQLEKKGSSGGTPTDALAVCNNANGRARCMSIINGVQTGVYNYQSATTDFWKITALSTSNFKIEFYADCHVLGLLSDYGVDTIYNAGTSITPNQSLSTQFIAYPV